MTANEMEIAKTELKALQRFRKGRGRWGVHDGHLFAMNPEQTAVLFVRPRTFDAAQAANVWYPPSFGPLPPSAYVIDLATGDITDLLSDLDVTPDKAALTSHALDPYLYPWKAKDRGSIEPNNTRVAVGTWKLAAQTFEAYNVKAVAAEYHGAFQWWTGHTRTLDIIVVTMGAR